MIRLEKINKSYVVGKENYKVLKDVDLTIADKEMLAILGKSGSGKTTLLNILGTIDKQDSGTYIIDERRMDNMSEGEKAKFRNQNIGFVMQEYSLINHKTVLFNVMLPMFFGDTKYKLMKEKAREALKKVDLAGVERKKANELSGGQRQRVAIARAIVNEPKYLLADEPTGALDTGTSEEIVNLLKSINKTGTTVIIVTHETMVAESCNRIIRICDGQVEE